MATWQKAIDNLFRNGFIQKGEYGAEIPTDGRIAALLPVEPCWYWVLVQAEWENVLMEMIKICAIVAGELPRKGVFYYTAPFRHSSL